MRNQRPVVRYIAALGSAFAIVAAVLMWVAPQAMSQNPELQQCVAEIKRIASPEEALSNQCTGWCCIDRLSWQR